MTLKDLAIKLRPLVEQAATSLPDDDAADGAWLFPAWAPGVDYKYDQRIRYGVKLYRVVQTHTSQDGWEPDKTPALFTEVPKPGEIPEWRQPTGAQDAYAKGDKVWHGGKVWESQVDANVWEPGVYGWAEVG